MAFEKKQRIWAFNNSPDFYKLRIFDEAIQKAELANGDMIYLSLKKGDKSGILYLVHQRQWVGNLPEKMVCILKKRINTYAAYEHTIQLPPGWVESAAPNLEVRFDYDEKMNCLVIEGIHEKQN